MSCYIRKSNAVVRDPRSFPCGSDPSGGAVSCCVSGDICLSNGVCAFSGPALPNLSGYYIGGCTDPAYAATSCHSQCSKWPLQDIIWSPGGIHDNTWSCCGVDSTTGGVTCASPKGPVVDNIPNRVLLVASASIDSVVNSTVPFGSVTALTATTTSASSTLTSSTSTLTSSTSTSSTSTSTSSTSTSTGSSMTGTMQVATTQALKQTAGVDSPAALTSALSGTQSVSAGDIAAIVLGVLLLLSWIGFGGAFLRMKRKARIGSEYSAKLTSAHPGPAAPVPAQPAVMARELPGDQPYTDRYSFG